MRRLLISLFLLISFSSINCKICPLTKQKEEKEVPKPLPGPPVVKELQLPPLPKFTSIENLPAIRPKGNTLVNDWFPDSPTQGFSTKGQEEKEKGNCGKSKAKSYDDGTYQNEVSAKVAKADKWFQSTRQGDETKYSAAVQYSGSLELFYEDFMSRRYQLARDIYNELIYDNYDLYVAFGSLWFFAKPISRMINESFVVHEPYFRICDRHPADEKITYEETTRCWRRINDYRLYERPIEHKGNLLGDFDFSRDLDKQEFTLTMNIYTTALSIASLEFFDLDNSNYIEDRIEEKDVFTQFWAFVYDMPLWQVKNTFVEADIVWKDGALNKKELLIFFAYLDKKFFKNKMVSNLEEYNKSFDAYKEDVAFYEQYPDKRPTEKLNPHPTTVKPKSGQAAKIIDIHAEVINDDKKVALKKKIVPKMNDKKGRIENLVQKNKKCKGKIGKTKMGCLIDDKKTKMTKLKSKRNKQKTEEDSISPELKKEMEELINYDLMIDLSAYNRQNQKTEKKPKSKKKAKSSDQKSKVMAGELEGNIVLEADAITIDDHRIDFKYPEVFFEVFKYI